MIPSSQTPEQIETLLEALRKALRERRLHAELQRPSVETPPTGHALFASHAAAEAAVCRLATEGVSLHQISVVGHGGAETPDSRLWSDGIFGLLRRTGRIRSLPELGGLIVLGPLSGQIAEAPDSGDGALIPGLVAMGIPRNQALRIRKRLQTGALLVLVHRRLTETPSAESERAMNNLEHKGDWNIAKGKLMQRWSLLTDDDLHYAEGKREELKGRIQKRTGETLESIEKVLQDLLH